MSADTESTTPAIPFKMLLWRILLTAILLSLLAGPGATLLQNIAQTN